MRQSIFLLFLGLSACQVALPEGQITCGPLPDDCPEGWRCNGENLCTQIADESDAGRDVLEGDVSGGDFDSGPEPGRDGGPPADAGMRDVPVVIEQDVPRLDAGPPPGNAALISSEATLSIDAIDVQGTRVFVAGTVAAGDVIAFGDESLSEGEGLWIARYDYDNDLQTLTLGWVRHVRANIRVNDLSVIANRVVVAGDFARFDALGESGQRNPDQVQGFLLDTGVGAGALRLLGTFGTAGGPASVRAIDAEGDSLCAVGSHSGGVSEGSFVLDGTGVGFLACFTQNIGSFTETNPAVSIADNPLRDIVLHTEGNGFAASRVAAPDRGTAISLSVAESRLLGSQTIWGDSRDALFVDHVADLPVLFGPSSEGHTLAVGLAGPGIPPTWEGSLPRDGGTFTPRALAVVGDRVHIVGRQAGVADLPIASGFHAVIEDVGFRVAVVEPGAESIDVVASIGEAVVVLGGRFIGDTSYPVPLQDSASNTLFLVAQPVSAP